MAGVRADGVSGGSGAAVAVGPLAVVDAGAVARLMGEAFAPDPAMRGVVTADDGGAAALARTFAVRLRWDRGLTVDVARRDGQVLGAALWRAPDARTPWWSAVPVALATVRALGFRGARVAAAHDRAFERARPARPHWYLVEVAVSADARGLGVGSALLGAGLARADAAGVGSYLEATTAGSRKLYERLGFEPRDPVDLGHGVVLRSMWRLPPTP